MIDNGTGDRFEADVSVANQVNRGFAVACNQGATIATGSVVVFLNNDCICHPGWLEPLVAAVSAHGVIAGAQLRYEDGRLQHAGVKVGVSEGVVTAWNILTEQEAGPCDAVTGACMAVDRMQFYALRGFDEGFVNGYEDVDICLRYRAGGGMCWYVPESVVTHLESQSGPARWANVHANVNRLHERWVGKL